MKGFLLIDIGTGSTRVGLCTQAGEMHCLSAFPNAALHEKREEPVRRWRCFVERLEETIRGLLIQAPDFTITAVSVDSARQSFVALDEKGQVCELFLNTENADEAIVASLKQRLVPDVFPVAGKPLTEDFLAPKLYQLKRNHLQRYRRIRAVVGFSEGVGAWMTGKSGMEYSQATESLLYDIAQRTWSQELIQAFEVDAEKLPPLLSSGTSLGAVRSDFLERIGYRRAAFPYVVGGADTQVGMSAFDLEAGDLVALAGTTSPVLELVDRFDSDRDRGFWMDADLGGHRVFREANPGIAGLNYQLWKESMLKDWTYEQLECYYRRAERIPVVAQLTSQVARNHQNRPRGAFFVETPLQPQQLAADFAMGILADHAVALAVQIQRLEAGKKSAGRIYVGGGSFRSSVFTEWVSALLQRPLIRLQGFEESTFYGLARICRRFLHLPEQERRLDEIIEPRTMPQIEEFRGCWEEMDRLLRKVEQ